MQAMKILVTGSSGTIGTRLCESLLARGEEVIGIDWVQNKWNKNIEAITRRLDLRRRDELLALDLPKDINAIIHLGANARVYELVEHPDRALDNFITLFNTLELARKLSVPRFIFASSRECYGNLPSTSFSEDLVRVEHCESPYTASKLGGEALVQSYTRCYGIEHVIFRFSNVYGMYDDSVRVVPLFIRNARKGESLMVFGKEKCLDFTYISDTVNGIMLAIDRFEEAKNETYNLAFGEGTTILHLAERVKELTKSESKIALGKPRTGEVIRFIADISKAKKKLGYAPKTSFETGIEKAVDWYMQHS